MRRWYLLLAAAAGVTALMALLGDVASSVTDSITLPYDRRLAHLDSLGAELPFTEGYQYVSERLRQGDGVVMFASSELSNRVTPFVAFNFLPDRLGLPLTAIGRGYFQSFPQYLLLSSLSDKLSAKSRLVIMFSPSWINSDRVPENFFPFYLQDDLVYQTSRLGGDLSDLSAYLRDRSHNLEHLSPALREVMWAWPEAESSGTRRLLGMGGAALLQAQGWSYPWQAGLRKLSMLIKAGEHPVAVPTSQLDWAETERQAAADETALMTNNQLWVHDEYYSHFLSAYPHGGAQIFPPQTYEATELFYLRRNLELLRSHDAKVLLVILPLNGRVYGDLDRFQPVRQQIRSLSQELGVQLYDMWEQPPEIGLMADAMHVGSLGWMRINHAIADWAR